LNVGNDFRFRRRPGERDVSEIHSELALMPAHWLQFDVYQSLEPEEFILQEFNSGITLRDGTAWSLRFGNNFLRQQIQDYSVDGRWRLTERFEALMRLQYDVRTRRFNEQAYGISQNLSNTWLISYIVSLYSGRRRESSFGFNVQVDTLGF
jgi:LPS-assembly protein